MKEIEVSGRTRIIGMAALVALLNTVLLLAWMLLRQRLHGTLPERWLDGLLVLFFLLLNFVVLAYLSQRIIWLLQSWQYRAERLWENWNQLQDSPSPMLLFIKDSEGRYQRVNQAFETLFGISDAQARGRSDLELFPSRYAQALHDNDLSSLAKKRLTGVEEDYPVGADTHSFYTIRVPLMDQRHEGRAVFCIATDSFPLRRAEQELRDNEKLLRMIFEHAPIAIGTVDLQGGIHNINPSCSRLFGYSSAEFRQLNLADIYPAEDLKSMLLKLEQLYRGEVDHIEAESRYVRKDGSELIGHQRLGLVRDEQGQPHLIVGLLEDITQRKADEAALREREEYLRLTFDNAPVGIAVADLGNQLIDVNTSQCKLLGYRREDMIGRPLEDFVHPDDWPVAERAIARLHRGESDSYALKGRFQHQNGDTVIAAARGGVVRDSHGKPVMLITQMQDITRQEQALAERRRLRHYLQNIIDSMPSMLVGVDSEGLVTQWNATASDKTGVQAEGAIGRPVAELLPMLASQLPHIRQAMAQRRPYHAQRLSMPGEGDNNVVDLVVYPLTANVAQGAVIRVDDVTARVRIEEVMVQTEKMLSVGGLAAGMAHEINNPLGAILQGAQNIRRRLSPELARNREAAQALGLDLDALQQYLQARGVLEFIDHIHDAGARAAKIVTDMLSFSRRSESHFQAVDVAELLDTSLRLAASDYDLKKRYDFKHIEVQRDYAADLTLSCDKTEIEQVILNLLRNAAQAMSDEGGDRHRITLRSRADGDHIIIEVEDNGPGMAPAVRKRVFEPFFTTKEVGVGTGLGLSVSYFIVTEQHRGSLSVRSTPGQGSCFRLRLPRQQEAD